MDKINYCTCILLLGLDCGVESVGLVECEAGGCLWGGVYCGGAGVLEPFAGASKQHFIELLGHSTFSRTS